MMGCRGFLLYITIAFLSLLGIQGQQAVAQVATQTSATQTSNQVEDDTGQNIIIGENGLIAVLPTDNVDVNLDNGLIAVVPGVQLPSIELPSAQLPSAQLPNTIQATHYSDALIAVVPSPETSPEQNDIHSASVEETVEQIEKQIEPTIVTETVTQEVTTNASETLEVAPVQSNVIEYVQGAIQNTISETPASEISVPETQEIIGITSYQDNVTQAVDNSSQAIASTEDNTTNTDVTNNTDVTKIDDSLQKVTIAVSEKTEENIPETTFEVKTQTVDDTSTTVVTGPIDLIPTDIETVGIALDYGYSLTAENTFIGNLMAAPLPSISDEIESYSPEVAESTTPDLETEAEAETGVVEEATEKIEEEVVTEVTEEIVEEETPDLTAIAKGTQFMAKLKLNDSTRDVLATDISEAIFHTYQIDVPEGQEVLTIMVEGESGDVDFAVKAGSEITSYNEVDYIDNSGGSSASYSYQFPPSGPIFIDVMNYTEEPVAYVLTISDDYDDAVSSSYDGSSESILAVRNRTAEAPIEPLATGHFFDLALNTVLSREIVGKKASATMVYHSYEIALPKGLEDVEVALDGQGHDVDLAVRLGKPIVRLDEVDFIDNSSDSTANYKFETLEDTVVYIDVMNHFQESAHYELEVIAENVELENSEVDTIRASVADADIEVITQVAEDVTTLKAGQRYEGLIANYLKIGEEQSAMAESQSFLIRVPEGVDRFVVTLASEEDLDLALKYASPIESYALKKQGGDWDYLDMRPTTDSRIQVDLPQAGFWYVDVIQATYGKGAAPYILQVFYP